MRARICSMICSTFNESDRILKSGMVSNRMVDDQRHSKGPERDAHEQRTVRQEQFRGAAAAFAPMDEIEITEDAVQGKRNRQTQPRRFELLLGLRADGVERVRDE